jgi:hypothetical protein
VWPAAEARRAHLRVRDAGNPRPDGPDAGGAAADASSVKKPVCPPGPYPAPVTQPARAVCANFAFNYTFNEGPTWVASQNAFFFSNDVSHQPTGGDIIKYSPGGACEFFLKDVGCDGLAVTPDGNIVGACQQSRAIVRFDVETKQSTIVADHYMGMTFNSPNDLVVHSNGTIYFSDPALELGNRPRGVGLAAFRVDPAGVVSVIVNSNSNGIALSPTRRSSTSSRPTPGIWTPSGSPPTRVPSLPAATDWPGIPRAISTHREPSTTPRVSASARTRLAPTSPSEEPTEGPCSSWERAPRCRRCR